jgi:starch synthase (maltosyl-transferring)
MDYLTGSKLAEEAAARAAPEDAAELHAFARRLCVRESAKSAVLEDKLCEIVQRHPDRQFTGHFGKELCVVVDREKARFSAWYEMFPRSCASDPVGLVVFQPEGQP